MKIEINIPSNRIADLMSSAIESGQSVYWCDGIFWKSRKHKPPHKRGCADPWYACCATYADPNLVLEIIEHGETEHHSISHFVKLADFKKAFLLMAEKFPQHFGDFMNENDDALTADLFLQLLALGEERYA